MSYWMKSLLLLPFLLAARGYASPLQKTFFDWQVTCNNLNFCVARNVPGDNGLVMTISRHAGANARPLLRIDYGNRYTGELKGGPLKENLLLDQQRLKPDLKHWNVEHHHWATTNVISIDEFLAQALEADSIQLTWRPQSAIALHGLKDVLLLMDATQGRGHDASAWIKRTDHHAVEVLPEPPPPQMLALVHPPLALTAEENRGLIDFATWRINANECLLDPLRRKVTVDPLSDDKALLLVSCEMGAYNVINLAFEVTRTQPYVARGLTFNLPFTPPNHKMKKMELMNAEYDTLTGELLTFSKNRGLGDCGTATRWQYNGREFVLAEYAEENTCDAWHGSDDWPTLWVSQHSVRQ